MNSIRVRVLVALLGMLVVSAVVMGALTYRNVLAETESLFDYQLRQMALSLRDQGEIAPAQASTLADEQLDFVVQIWTEDGRVLYPPRLRADLPARALLGLANVTVNGTAWRTFSVATRDRVIQVAQPLQTRKKLAANAALRSVAPLLVIAPVMALAIWWLAAQALAPLKRVADGVRARDEQSLQPLPTVGLPDEVSPLVAALNGLLQRLGASLGAQRAFVADAAHELRSPLTALKLQMQLLRRAPDEAARAQAVDALNAGIDRAARLVEQLLALARTEPGAPLPSPQRIDLAALVRTAVADTLPFAAARGTQLDVLTDEPTAAHSMPRVPAGRAGNAAGDVVGNVTGDRSTDVPDDRPSESPIESPIGPPIEAPIEAPIDVPGDRFAGPSVQPPIQPPAQVQIEVLGEPSALSALVRNLVDNAVRYSPHGARVELRVRMEEDGPVLLVDDSGPGIPRDERERVFDRFYRHAAGDETGSGLGLAIVSGVAARHGARVTLDDSPLGGLRVRVKFASVS